MSKEPDVRVDFVPTDTYMQWAEDLKNEYKPNSNYKVPTDKRYHVDMEQEDKEATKLREDMLKRSEERGRAMKDRYAPPLIGSGVRAAINMVEEKEKEKEEKTGVDWLLVFLGAASVGIAGYVVWKLVAKSGATSPSPSTLTIGE